MNKSPIIIDLTYFYSLTGGDKSFEQMLLSGTVADVHEKIQGLEAAWEAKEAAGVRKNAHSLVSLSAIAGMPQVEGWCRTIDQGFADGVFHPEMAMLVNNVIAGWPAAKLQLEDVMAAG